jgi:hypothetical protein
LKPPLRLPEELFSDDIGGGQNPHDLSVFGDRKMLDFLLNHQINRF